VILVCTEPGSSTPSSHASTAPVILTSLNSPPDSQSHVSHLQLDALFRCLNRMGIVRLVAPDATTTAIVGLEGHAGHEAAAAAAAATAAAAAAAAKGTQASIFGFAALFVLSMDAFLDAVRQMVSAAVMCE